MTLTNEKADALIKSIYDLATEIKNVDRRLQGLSEKLGTLAKAITTSSSPKKD